MAPAQRARAGREGLGDRPARTAPGFTAANVVLVVRDGRRHRLDRHPAPDLPRRRPQVARRLRAPAGAARRAHRRARRVPALPVLGPDRVDRLDALDHRGDPRRCMREPALRPRAWSTCRTSTTTCSASAPSRRRPTAPPPSSTPRSRRCSTTPRGAGVTVIARREYGIEPRRPARRHQPGAAPRGPARGLHAGRAASSSTRGRRARSPSPTTRSRTSTSPTPPTVRRVRDAAAALPGVDEVLDRRRAGGYGLDHERSGELVAGRRARRLVHLLLLARRRPRARLRPRRRHPPQARLRPRRALLRPRRPLGEGQRRAAAWCARSSACATR